MAPILPLSTLLVGEWQSPHLICWDVLQPLGPPACLRPPPVNAMLAQTSAIHVQEFKICWNCCWYVLFSVDHPIDGLWDSCVDLAAVSFVLHSFLELNLTRSSVTGQILMLPSTLSPLLETGKDSGSEVEAGYQKGKWDSPVRTGTAFCKVPRRWRVKGSCCNSNILHLFRKWTCDKKHEWGSPAAHSGPTGSWWLPECLSPFWLASQPSSNASWN